MRNAHLILATALAAFLLLATSAQAQIYKWVDEKGVTHYGEKPPENTKSTTVDVPKAAPESKPSRDGPQDWAEKEAEFRKRQLNREAVEKAEEKKKAARARECVEARDHLDYESQGGRFYDRNDKGDKVYRTDAQQEAVVAAARKRVDELCR